MQAVVLFTLKNSFIYFSDKKRPISLTIMNNYLNYFQTRLTYITILLSEYLHIISCTNFS